MNLSRRDGCVLVLFHYQNMLSINLAYSDEVSRNAYYAHIDVPINHEIQVALVSLEEAQIEIHNSMT